MVNDSYFRFDGDNTTPMPIAASFLEISSVIWDNVIPLIWFRIMYIKEKLGESWYIFQSALCLLMA